MKALASRPVGLMKVEEARSLLAKCKRVDEVKHIRDQAAAIEAYLRQQHASREAQNDAAEIKLHATVRLGELAAELEKSKGAAQPRGGPRARTRNVPARASPPTLSDLGITHSQSSRWQELARIPKEELECFIAEQRAKPDGEVTTSGLRREHAGKAKLQRKRAVADQIRAEPPPIPEGPFRVIAIDPPWRYGSRVEDASHRGRNQYPDMSVEEICALPVAAKAHPDGCVLWLWTTNAFMRDAYRCLDAWGFQEKTILTWDKQLLGLGDWLRNITEHCILAVRGTPVVQLTNQTTLISEARREHSRKPEAFYALVEALCPGSKLEMFGRESREGWTLWGAETEKFAEANG